MRDKSMIKIYNLSDISEEDILCRTVDMPDVSADVEAIIKNVRANGDAALREYCFKFDGVELDGFEVSEWERERSLASLDAEYFEILEEAAENIRAYHQCQKKSGYVLDRGEGIVLGQKVMALERVGLYIPGGTASYPSTVLMNCIPAKIAGVPEIVMTTPPDKDGRVSPQIIAAAAVAGVDRIFKCGGAQAVAALAYGTESIPRVDKIVGPGNIFVAEAKRQVYGDVDIDMIAGPSEILIISDELSEPRLLAADLLSQAEHDKLATAVLVTTSEKLAGEVAEAIENQLSKLPREEIARASIERNGKIIVVESIDQAIHISNSIAPEHLELCIEKPFEYLTRIRNAGSIFMGRYCPEALGDYFAGTNHTLPTGGRARFSSPLSVDDFVKKSSFMYYSCEALGKVADKIAYFAEVEGLSGHARSAVSRTKTEESRTEE